MPLAFLRPSKGKAPTVLWDTRERHGLAVTALWWALPRFNPFPGVAFYESDGRTAYRDCTFRIEWEIRPAGIPYEDLDDSERDWQVLEENYPSTIQPHDPERLYSCKVFEDLEIGTTYRFRIATVTDFGVTSFTASSKGWTMHEPPSNDTWGDGPPEPRWCG